MGQSMKYCVQCGHKLELKHLADEGMVPYCTACAQFRFPTYNVAVSTEVMSPNKDKVLLIKQYNKDKFILVAGYVNLGESPEDAVKREVMEEVGLQVERVEFNCSQYFAPSNTLMINFRSIVADETLHVKQDEVDFAQWFSIADARANIARGSLAEYFLRRSLGDDCTYEAQDQQKQQSVG